MSRYMYNELALALTQITTCNIIGQQMSSNINIAECSKVPQRLYQVTFAMHLSI